MIRCLGFLVCLLPVFASAQPARILLDGSFADWESLSLLGTDPANDAPGDGPDFLRAWASNDERFLFLSFETTAPYSLQDGVAIPEFNSNVRLYLDTDADPSTGFSFGDIGAELVWSFGTRTGTFYPDNIPARHYQFGLVTAPTVTNSRFEVAIRRDAEINFQSLFKGDQIRFVLMDVDSQDRMPDVGYLSYTFGEASNLPPLPEVRLAKDKPEHLRVLTYNVLNGGLFHGSLTEAYGRVLRAIDPDVISFQEIYRESALEVADRMHELLPLPEGERWHTEKIEPDLVVASRYPVLHSYQAGQNAAFRLDLSSRYATPEFLLFVAHPPCCANDAERQAELDAMMAFLRDARTDETIAPNTPIVIAGDLNLVGDARQLTTLLDGDIFDEATHGPDFAPDWDGSALANVRAYATGLPLAFTWRNARESFTPGYLDYILYSDAVLGLGNHFVLYTPGLTAEQRLALGLDLTDAAGIPETYEFVPSDHLPLVADFVLADTGTASEPATAPTEFSLINPHPHPVTSSTRLAVTLVRPIRLSATLYDVLGRQVKSVMAATLLSTGTHTLTLDLADLPTGPYLLVIAGEGERQQRVIVRMD